MAANHVRLSSSVTVTRFLEMQTSDDREAAGRFIRERFNERYLSPVLDVDRNQRHGFSMMAVACLTIEALQAFRLGLPTTRNNSAKLFAAFFAEHPAFADSTDGKWFYDNIRCGLLHEAEARGGWRIRREGPHVDKNSRVSNAVRFFQALRGAVHDYASQLHEDETWKRFKRRMKQVIRSCDG
jgi:hypothetical protein